MMPQTDIESIWADDLLGRRDDADFLKKFLLNRIDERKERGASRSYVLNLDAGWGHGKSFFLERFARDLEAEGYIVAKMNAWRDDHADDPLIAVIAAIDEAVAPHIRDDAAAKERWRSLVRTGAVIAATAAKGVTKHWLGKWFGDGLGEIKDYIDLSQEEKDALAEKGVDAATAAIDKKAEQVLARFKEGQRTIGRFREQLEEFLKKHEEKGGKTPLFVLIDEVDRCRPTFSIELLERVKHIFDMDNVVFVMATNTSQLRHSIGAVYGLNFDSERYLYRFFDRTYTFEDPSIENYVSSLISAQKVSAGSFNIPPGHTLQSYVAGCFYYLGISLRDAEQCMDILRSCVTVWDRRASLELTVLLPMVVAHHQKIELEPIFSLKDRLVAFKTSHAPKRDGWTIKFRGMADRFSETVRPQDVNGLELLNSMAGLAAKSLPELMSETYGRSPERWVIEQYRNEFTKEYGNSYSPEAPPYSLVSEYPALIRSAGRLIPSAGKA